MAKAPQTSASLVERLRDLRDEAAWIQFVQIYAPLVYGWLRKQGLQDADAADLTQDALRAATQALPELEYDPRHGSFRGWLFTIVRNRLCSFRVRRREQGSGDSQTLHFLQEIQQEEPGEQEWEQEYRRRLFAWAAEQVREHVSDGNWHAFWQTSVQGKSAVEAARLLRMSVSAVYTAKSRVLARIKNLIEQVKEEWSDGD
ncbi:MAG: sigma-70 family RNA polymerase sigma factor [Gemmataceae bacterium]|nr:sigma-70 family RNA polymerase sigma factor [Gemmataceae bacterium]